MEGQIPERTSSKDHEGLRIKRSWSCRRAAWRKRDQSESCRLVGGIWGGGNGSNDLKVQCVDTIRGSGGGDFCLVLGSDTSG